jgi:UDP-N-acetylglucosamine 3-dehydrogenase
MPRKLGVGVVGVGVFGEQHAKVYSQLEHVRLVGVADLDEARAEQVAKSYGAKAFGDYNELVARANIDLVAVCTPDEAHLHPVLAALSAGKHVFVEKPFATSVADCAKMMSAAKLADRKLTVGQILRFDPRYHVARETIARGDVGDIVHLTVRRNNQLASADRLAGRTSVLFFLGVHDLDFMNWCVGSKIQRVYCESTRRVLDNADDTYLALIRYENGVIASLEASWVLPRGYVKLEAEAEIVCTNGTVFVDGGANALRLATSGPVNHPDVTYGPEVAGVSYGALRHQLSHFVDCVRFGSEPLVPPEEAAHAVAGICAMERSLKTGAPVYLDRRRLPT